MGHSAKAYNHQFSVYQQTPQAHTLFAISVIVPMRDLIIQPDRDIRRLLELLLVRVALLELVVLQVLLQRVLLLFRELCRGDLVR